MNVPSISSSSLGVVSRGLLGEESIVFLVVISSYSLEGGGFAKRRVPPAFRVDIGLSVVLSLDGIRLFFNNLDVLVDLMITNFMANRY